jgi:UDP-3-O-[3-hydroxymyristoyl] glucosamine N-acyltransferase
MLTVGEIALLVEGKVIGDSTQEIQSVAKIEEAQHGEITFLANEKYEKYIATTMASAIIVGRNFLHTRENISYIITDDPYGSFLITLEKFHVQSKKSSGEIHPTAVIPATVSLGSNVSIDAYVVLGERNRIGDNVTLCAGIFLGDDVSIGEQTYIYPNVTIQERTEIGKNNIIHSGVVIGSDGFGFAPNKDGVYKKIPQVGHVVTEDDVEIGANTTIDRATIGETRIKCGTKIDNLVQIAHNVVIGEHTVIAAQTGISGSTKIGNHCIIGGQVGIGGHLTIAERTTIGAQSGVTKSFKETGKTISGYPAKEHRVAMKLEAAHRQLPVILQDLDTIQQRLALFEKEIKK